MKKHASLITRKFGPLPFWAWAVIGGGLIYWYRNRSSSSSTSTLGAATPGGQGVIQGPEGPEGPTGPAGPRGLTGVISRKHHPKPRKKKTRDGKHRKKQSPRSKKHVDKGAGHHKAVAGHHTGAGHTHRAKPKKVIGKGRGSHVTHSGVHHDAHGNRQVRNEPHGHAGPIPQATAGRKARGRVPGHKAALISAHAVPRGAGRPRVGHAQTGASAERGLPTHTATSPHVRNRVAEPPAQGHVRRQAVPSRAERPVVLRGGRQPDNAQAARTPHTTSKQPGQPSRAGSRHTRRRAN